VSAVRRGVVVTGGAGGIGRAVAAAFAADGAAVAIWDVDGVAADAAARELGAFAVEVDVGVRAQVERALASTLAELQTVDVLVNDAAIMIRGELLELPEEAWDDVLRTNLKSAFLCTQALGRHWVANGIAGAIVNVTSVDAAIQHTFFPHYCAAKAGLRSLTKATALALAPYGIRANEVAPGFTTPGMAARIVATPAWVERVDAFVPLGRSGSADEVAAAVLFLAGPGASYITAAELVVDGGHTIGAHDWVLRQLPQDDAR
jgi:NAD(P)-dependent dehydrogenase (short-subunit alcohol dehydrogenase family)